MSSMPLEGGLIDRLVEDAAHAMYADALTTLGWFASHPSRQPVLFTTEPLPPGQEIKPNLLALTSDDMPPDEVELGSDLAEYAHTFYLDIYAEDDSVGKHLAGDCRSIAEGKMPSAGRTTRALPVWAPGADPDVDEPAFVALIEDIVMERVYRETPRSWERHWWTVRFDVVEVH